MDKLLVVAPSYYPKIGGVENHLTAVLNRLVREYNVTVVVRYDDALPRVQDVGGIKVYRLPKKVRSPQFLWWLVRNSSVLRGVSLVHSHDYYPRWLRRLLGPNKVRWVHTFHGYEGYPVAEEAIRARQQVRKEADYCFGVGQFIEKWYGTKCDNIIYGAIDPDIYKPSNASTKWDHAFIGRLEEDTGFKDYFKAMCELNLSSRTKGVVVGGGSLMPWAEAYMKETGADVSFVGVQKDIQGYIAQTKVLFVSGYLGILEGAAMKKPIVAHYDTPIKKDYLECHPLADIIYIAKDSADIAKYTVKAAAGDKEKIDKAHKWAKQQSWSKLADLYRDAYRGEE